MKTNKNAIKQEAGGFSMINRPDYIESAHWNEWLASAVAPEIIVLNLVSLLNNLPYDYLLYSDRISRRNDGRLREYLLQKYRHIEHGGWWCSGVDPLDNCNPMLWGCFKPDIPRRDSQKIEKFIKYEHPYRVPTRAFFLRVTWNIGLTIATTANQQAQYEQRILQAYRQTQVNGEGSREQGSRGAGEQGGRGAGEHLCRGEFKYQVLSPDLSPSAPLPLRPRASSLATGFERSDK
ncbi:hypothetical protein [Nostoc sphaeroides]|uniref:hypothetical protein n=1 Tax=Nostoc sphaeroides TaxID=446679 RepID=UPI002B400182|nr:hypothetical protein [Nostoc sphaeroides]